MTRAPRVDPIARRIRSQWSRSVASIVNSRTRLPSGPAPGTRSTPCSCPPASAIAAVSRPSGSLRASSSTRIVTLYCALTAIGGYRIRSETSTRARGPDIGSPNGEKMVECLLRAGAGARDSGDGASQGGHPCLSGWLSTAGQQRLFDPGAGRRRGSPRPVGCLDSLPVAWGRRRHLRSPAGGGSDRRDDRRLARPPRIHRPPLRTDRDPTNRRGGVLLETDRVPLRLLRGAVRLR